MQNRQKARLKSVAPFILDEPETPGFSRLFSQLIFQPRQFFQRLDSIRPEQLLVVAVLILSLIGFSAVQRTMPTVAENLSMTEENLAPDSATLETPTSDPSERWIVGERIGTCFVPVTSAVESRKRYLLTGGKLADRLVIDDGAVQAVYGGSSLLSIGLKSVHGTFERGGIVRILDMQGREIARGLVNYASVDLARISGHHSNDIEKILGYAYGDEVIHRNNLVQL